MESAWLNSLDIGILVGVGWQWSIGQCKDSVQAYITRKRVKAGLCPLRYWVLLWPWPRTFMCPDACEARCPSAAAYLRGGLSHGIVAVAEIAESRDDIAGGLLAGYQGPGWQ